MKPSQIFHQYIWIINTLRAYRKLTLDELSQKWQEDGVTDGNPLPRASFNRHRDAIQDMFGIIIDCNPRTYKYYISNSEVLSDDSIEHWLFSTLTVHGVLADSAAVKERLVLENAPVGEQYLDIRPTADFLGQLLSHGNGIEVLEPLELREKMRQLIAENLKRY